MSVLKYRLTLGPVMVLALIGVIWLDEWLDGLATPARWIESIPALRPTLPPGIMLLALGLLVVPLAARELASVFRAGGIHASRRWLSIAAMAGLLVSALTPAGPNATTGVALVGSVATGILIASLLWHIREQHLQGAAAAAGSALFAFVYLGLMFGFVIALRREVSAWVVLGVLVVTKSADTGAFATGKLIGKHKLIPWLSPGKTWEGLAGGVLTAAGMAVLGVWLAKDNLAVWPGAANLSLGMAAVVGFLFALTAQAGDLLASVLKRDAGLKDSGKLPGFGGVLDVLDSVLLVGPVAYWVLPRG